jgi:hypothetical protein
LRATVSPWSTFVPVSESIAAWFYRLGCESN